MKLFYGILLLLCTQRVCAQAVFADPALGQAFFTKADGVPVDLPPVLARETRYILNIPVFNNNTANAIPAGTTKLKIGLGSKLALDPAFDLSATNTSAYFNWTAETVSGQVQLTGDQFAPIPAGFADTALFDVRGIILGVSTVTANFLVTNHTGGAITLSDDNGANNLTAQAYFINESLPVTFTGLYVTHEQCTAVVRFTTADEYNLKHFVVEYSANGITFSPALQLQPRGNGTYDCRFAVPGGVTGNIIYIRIRSVDIDGRQQLSSTTALRGICNGERSLTAYPNPVYGTNKRLSIQINNGVFDGLYTVSLFNAAGARLQTQKLQLNNTRKFEYTLHTTAAGQYQLQLEKDGEVPVVVPIQQYQ